MRESCSQRLASMPRRDFIRYWRQCTHISFHEIFVATRDWASRLPKLYAIMPNNFKKECVTSYFLLTSTVIEGVMWLHQSSLCHHLLNTPKSYFEGVLQYSENTLYVNRVFPQNPFPCSATPRILKCHSRLISCHIGLICEDPIQYTPELLNSAKLT